MRAMSKGRPLGRKVNKPKEDRASDQIAVMVGYGLMKHVPRRTRGPTKVLPMDPEMLAFIAAAIKKGKRK